ncbi:MAG: SPFH domain-containing protein [Proteobacteria bacterium]|jgi:hypothetical protein|nr:SPFH domain-containing protein [Pseudomonadota bacterium]
MDPRKVLLLLVSVILCVVVCFSLFGFFENLDAKQLMVIQSPVKGQLDWYTSQGVKYQGFGKVTCYDRRSQFWFSAKNDQGAAAADNSIKIRFNDGGHAQLSGGISWEMPLDEEHLTRIHQQYGSHLAVEQQLIRTIIEKSIYMTGPTMSSKESYAERRNELLNLIEDQIQNGVYLTKTTQEQATDPLTGAIKTIAKVELVTDKDGKPKRAEESPLKQFGIKVFNLSINEVAYDPQVEEQISQQQKLTMQVQIAMATAKQAEQECITTKKQGEANAAKAEWEQKTVAAKEVAKADQDKTVAETKAKQEKSVAETKAAQELKVAELAAQAAEMTKKEQIALGEGEAKRRTLVMEADGALEKKLAAWVEINKAYAEAIAKHEGSWVPSIVMGNGATGTAGAQNGASDLIALLTAKTAKDLSLDPNMVQPTKKK